MIAIAVACEPKLLIADEPTTALDVTIQAQILRLLTDLKIKLSMSMLFITHNLGVVAEVADRVVVMYAGRAVEEADVLDIFEAPSHPYSRGLLASIPGIDESPDGARLERLPSIRGGMPSATRLPPGCAFEPRCEHTRAECCLAVPPMEEVATAHLCRCLRWREI
jgi:oligopeptide/dipeptide ABC transporter ATP-binding protein